MAPSLIASSAPPMSLSNGRTEAGCDPFRPQSEPRKWLPAMRSTFWSSLFSSLQPSVRHGTYEGDEGHEGHEGYEGLL